MTDSAPDQRSILIVCRKAPYGNSISREALDIALATSVFEQKLALVFTGEGVWQLVKDQDSSQINSKNQGKLLSAFPIYDINNIYIDAESLDQRQLKPESLLLKATVLSRRELANMIDNFEIIFNF